MVKALFFDLTDTLQEFDWSKQWKLLLPVFEKELRQKIDKKEFITKYQLAYEVYRLGKIKNDIAFLDLLLRMLALQANKKRLAALAKKHMELRKNYTWLPKGYNKTLTELRKDFKLAVVSSGAFPWAYYDYKHFFGFEFDKHFDLVVDSYTIGHLKESGVLFEVALKKLGLKNNEVAFVGNSYKSDVLVAKKFGLKAIFLNKKNAKKGKADLSVKTLAELAKRKKEIAEL